MKRKPWPLIIIAVLHILAPFGNLLLNAARAGRTIPDQWFYWSQILPKYLFFIYVIIPVVAGVCIYICRRWTYWLYLVCLGLVFISNVYSYTTHANLGSLITLIILLIIDLLVVAYFVVPSVQKVYFDPRLRWWEAAPRYNFDHEGQVNGSTAFIKNLGQGGLFMSSCPDLKEGDQADVFWNFEGLEVRMPGKVVYKSNRPGFPGCGVKFDANPEGEKKVAQVVATLHRRKKIVVERLPGPEDSFGVWLKKLFTKGEGLFPKFRS
jgi:hypothetical protein